MRRQFFYKSLNKAVGQALHRFDMIRDGDKIAIAVSGGKDSLSLLWILQERLKRIPISYELYPIYIDPGFEGGFGKGIEAYCKDIGYNLRIEWADFGIKGHSPENKENPCFLCSRLRRKKLFEIAKEIGCNKLALGHHKDDIIETLFINICYAGEISTMLPKQNLFNGKLTIIRPLALADENMIKGFVKDQNFPKFDNPCPSAKLSKRKEIKKFLNQLYESNKKIKGNIFTALSHVKADYLLVS